MLDFIQKTRMKKPLTYFELEFIVKGFMNGEIPDYQMSSWLMAVCFQSLTENETANLTQLMAQSGRQLSWEGFAHPPIDKHSTGGVADTTTLLLIPLVAACGITVAKMSGRGLGFTGGTLDKVDTIPGFRSILSEEDFYSQLKNHQLALTGQSADLAPADGKIYALRDASGTVESLPLIASSVMSKKLAAGCPALVLDIKTGSGGFMKNPQEAKTLADLMVHIGQSAGRKVVACLTSMEQPLGNHIGNTLEVEEAILLLKNANLTSDLARVTIALAAEMILLGGVVSSLREAHELVRKVWLNKQALEKMREWITLQGGNSDIIDLPLKLPQATFQETLRSSSDGFVVKFDTEGLGILARDLGAGRLFKEDSIDPTAGLILRKRLGDSIAIGEPWLTAQNSSRLPSDLMERAQKLIQISTSPSPIPRLFIGRISSSSFHPSPINKNTCLTDLST